MWLSWQCNYPHLEIPEIVPHPAAANEGRTCFGNYSNSDPTHENNTLALILSNLHHYYQLPLPLAPFERTNHLSILWTTKPTMCFKFTVTTKTYHAAHSSNHQSSPLYLDLFVLFSPVRLHFLNKPIITSIIIIYTHTHTHTYTQMDR